jgi:predicted transcriptional regulator
MCRLRNNKKNEERKIKILQRISVYNGDKPLRKILNGIIDVSNGNKLLKQYSKEGLIEIKDRGNFKVVTLTKKGIKRIL